MAMRFLLLLALALLAPAAALAAEPTVPLKTTELGRGPVIVLVHDFGSTRMQWMPTARKLLGRHRVVMLDLPGHGESGMPSPFSLEAAAASLAGALGQHKAESTIVVGHGLGGMLALMAASRNPGLVKGVVVIDGWTRPPQPVPDQMQRHFLRQLDTNYDAFLRQLFMNQGRDTSQGVILHAQAAQLQPAYVKSYMGQLLNADASATLRNLKPRLLYIGTERHWPAGKNWSDLAPLLGYQGAGAMETRRIANAGPLVAKEQPDTLATVLAEFAARAMAAK